MLGFLAFPTDAAVTVSRFALTPSTTQAGGHPTLDIAVVFDPPTSDVRGISIHLPAGLTAEPRAAPFCPRGRLLSDLCPLETRIGKVTLAGEALGFRAEAERNIYNLRPSVGQQLRLGVSIFGSFSRGGLALILPVTARPGDGGLDMAVAGPPKEVAGYEIKISEVDLKLRGLVRRRTKGRVRRRALLTNPSSCQPATSVLEISSSAGLPATITQTSSFTPTGC
jgi:hypothetical protein